MDNGTKEVMMKHMTFVVGMILSAVLVALSLATGLLGPVGEAVEAVFVGLLGVVAWTVPVELVYSAVLVARGRSFSAFRAFGDLVIIAVAASLVHLGFDAGGVIGEAVGDAARGCL